MKKRILAITVLLCFALALSACGQQPAATAPSAAAAPADGAAADPGDDFHITIKFSGASAATNPDMMMLDEMCKRVTERTDGHITMEMYPNNELGSLADIAEMIQQGVPMMTNCSSDFLADYCPDHAALNGAYLYDSWEDMQVIAKSDWYAGLKGQLDDSNIHVMFFGWNGGHRHMISTFPIRTPQDLVGKNARVSGGLMFVEMYKAFGSSPITLPFNETYQGLQQGIIDIVEAPTYTLLSSSLNEVGPYLTLTSHIICADVVIMSTDVYNSIPEQYRAILDEEVNATCLAYNATVDGNEEEALETFRDYGTTIIELSDEERQAFADACKDMYTNIQSFSPDIYNTIRSIIEADLCGWPRAAGGCAAGGREKIVRGGRDRHGKGQGQAALAGGQLGAADRGARAGGRLHHHLCQCHRTLFFHQIRPGGCGGTDDAVRLLDDLCRGGRRI